VSARAAGAPPHERRAAAAGAAASLALFALYAASAAPDVTFWDAGEFVAAFATLGIPHPPGTPLFVCLGRAWVLALGAAGIGVAPAAALLAAACTAAAGGLTAALVTRWTRSAAGGVGAAVCAGTMSTAWGNATEAEVYAPALLLAVLAIYAGDRAGRPPGVRPVGGRATAAPAASPGRRWTTAAAYALALSVPLHLSVLVAAPAVAWLAAGDVRRRLRPSRAAVIVGTSVAAAGAAGASWAQVVVGGLVLVASCGWPLGDRPGPGDGRARPVGGGEGDDGGRRQVALGAAVAVAVALSAVFVLLVRARHDPWLNQGSPSTWTALGEVLARRQYAPAPPWPRQAPWWLQAGNLFEWADWQVALGVDGGAPPSWRRTPVTIAYAALGAVGAAWHRRRDRRSFGAWALVLACGSLGVAAYLNLKAGPTYGVGVLSDAAPREARERDYFFVLAWWAWGAWAGVGAVVLARRVATRARAGRHGPAARTLGGLALAALPATLNWRAADRRREPAASTPAAFARALLESAPPRAVLLVAADNDSYPLWAAQAGAGVRRDVTPVTLSLLPAAWYRAELERRHALVPRTLTAAWHGEAATWQAIAVAAAARGRPLVTSTAVAPAVRDAIGGVWAHTGLLVERVPGPRVGARALDRAPPAVAARLGVALVDTAALRASARLVSQVAPTLFARVTHRGADPDRADAVGAWARRQLACPPRCSARGGVSSRRPRRGRGAP
jgi:hypothetical protein